MHDDPMPPTEPLYAAIFTLIEQARPAWVGDNPKDVLWCYDTYPGCPRMLIKSYFLELVDDKLIIYNPERLMFHQECLWINISNPDFAQIAWNYLRSRDGMSQDYTQRALFALIRHTAPTQVVLLSEVRTNDVDLLRATIQVNVAHYSNGESLRYFIEVYEDKLLAIDQAYEREERFECPLADPAVLEKLWEFVLTPWPPPHAPDGKTITDYSH